MRAVLMLGLATWILSACGGGSDGGGGATDGGSADGGEEAWQPRWNTTDQGASAADQYLMVLGQNHYLLLQQFKQEADNPTGPGVFRSVELRPDQSQHVASLARAGADVLFHGASGAGAAVVLQEGDLLIAYVYDGSSWKRDDLTSVADAHFAVGIATDGAPRVAVEPDATPGSIQLFSLKGGNWSEQKLTASEGKTLGAVGEDSDGKVFLVFEHSTTNSYHAFVAGQEVDVTKSPPRLGYPYMLIAPGAAPRYFTRNTTFDNYTGMISLLDGSWETYELPIVGLPREHSLFDGDLEHFHRHDSDQSVYACRRGSDPWTTLAIRRKGLSSSFSVDDLHRDGNRLVLATTGSQLDRVLTLELSECGVR